MGRNAIPKLGEWRDGALCRIHASGEGEARPDDGKHVLYTRETKAGTEILACAWADGLCELLAAFFQSGYQRGKRDGRAEKAREIRKALESDGGSHA